MRRNPLHIGILVPSLLLVGMAGCSAAGDSDGSDGDRDPVDRGSDGEVVLPTDGSAETPDNGDDGGGGSQKGEGCGSNLTGLIRDFHMDHPDMEIADNRIGLEKGIVGPVLGADRKPVYRGGNGVEGKAADVHSTTDAATFAQWYNDVPGVNESKEYTLTFEPIGDGIYRFESSAFFPIDGELFGNELPPYAGNPDPDNPNNHNYHFTFELHTVFKYSGGEIFRFKGDDDVWVFINGQLVVDLGGVHWPEEGLVSLDQQAATLGIQPGQSYPMDFFFAERHALASNFLVDTSLEFVDCGIIIR